MIVTPSRQGLSGNSFLLEYNQYQVIQRGNEMIRMRGSILCAFLVLIVWTGYTQAGVEKEALPVIEVEVPTYDFGRASQGEVVKHDFRVFNRGTAPLDIKSVKPG